MSNIYLDDLKNNPEEYRFKLIEFAIDARLVSAYFLKCINGLLYVKFSSGVIIGYSTIGFSGIISVKQEDLMSSSSWDYFCNFTDRPFKNLFENEYVELSFYEPPVRGSEYKRGILSRTSDGWAVSPSGLVSSEDYLDPYLDPYQIRYLTAEEKAEFIEEETRKVLDPPRESDPLGLFKCFGFSMDICGLVDMNRSLEGYTDYETSLKNPGREFMQHQYGSDPYPLLQNPRIYVEPAESSTYKFFDYARAEAAILKGLRLPVTLLSSHIDPEKELRSFESYMDSNKNLWSEDFLFDTLDDFCDRMEDFGYNAWIDSSIDRSLGAEYSRILINKFEEFCIIRPFTIIGKYFGCAIKADSADYYADALIGRIPELLEPSYEGTWSSESVSADSLIVSIEAAKNTLMSANRKPWRSTNITNHLSGLSTSMYEYNPFNLEINVKTNDYKNIRKNIDKIYKEAIMPSMNESIFSQYFAHGPIYSNLFSFNEVNKTEGDFSMERIIKNETSEFSVQLPWPGANPENVKIQVDTKTRKILMTLPKLFGSESDESVERQQYVTDRYDLDTIKFKVDSGIVDITVKTKDGIVRDVTVSE